MTKHKERVYKRFDEQFIEQLHRERARQGLLPLSQKEIQGIVKHRHALFNAVIK